MKLNFKKILTLALITVVMATIAFALSSCSIAGGLCDHQFEEDVCVRCRIKVEECFDFILSDSKNTYSIKAKSNESLPKNLYIPATYKGKPITKIEESAFVECSRIRSVVISENVTTIGTNAFFGCKNITDVEIPKSVSSIDPFAFSYCKNLVNITVDQKNSSYESKDGNLYTKGGRTIVQYAIGKKNETFEIPSTVMAINSGAFYMSQNIKSVEIPQRVTSIGNEAFLGCGKLQSVTIPNSVIKIHAGAFKWCASLTSVTLGNSVTNIYDSAFAYCTNLSSLVIPDNVISVGKEAFIECYGLKSVVIGNKLTVIDEYTFKNCISLSSVIIGDGVKTINPYAFEGCISLKSVLFKNASDWTVDGAKVPQKNLADSKKAAEYLTTTYVSATWKR